MAFALAAPMAICALTSGQWNDARGEWGATLPLAACFGSLSGVPRREHAGDGMNGFEWARAGVPEAPLASPEGGGTDIIKLE